MGISSISDYATHLASAVRWLPPIISQRTVQPGAGVHQPNSLWTQQTPPGVAPTTAVAPDYTTVGSIGQATSAAFRVARVRLGQIATQFGFGMFMLADRLSHQGGLVGNSASTQTTNLPTAALTRSTSGVGVMAAIEVYTTVGNTAFTITASYTNSAGTSGRTTKEAAYSSAGDGEVVGRLVILPPQDGDVGFRSVESVTNSSTGAGVAGNLGVTLFKPYLIVPLLSPLENLELDAVQDLGIQMPLIPQNACLWWIYIAGASTLPASFLEVSTITD